jgi:hypothetical protein
MVVSVDFVDVQSDHVDHLYDHFLEMILQLSLIYEVLILMEVQRQDAVIVYLVAPKRNDFRHWILLEAGHRNGF